MKYFTPERYIRLQDVSDERSTRAAIDDWEIATLQYSLHLQTILGDLPKTIRSFAQSGSLHDAEVLAMWQKQPTRLKIVVQPEIDPAHVLVLGYALAEAPRVNPAALPEPFRTAPPTWLYDEIGIAKQGKKPIFTHNILLSNGWEMELRFHRMTVARNAALVPGQPEGRPAVQGAMPRSA
jgi:hypothetical protein